MSSTLSLAAQLRDRVGKGSSRAARNADRTPAVIYGAGKNTLPVTLSSNELSKGIKKGGFMTRIISLDLGNGEAEKVIARDVQLHPVSDRPLHVDFLRIGGGQKFTIEIPVRFKNHEASPGLKRGGVLTIVRHAIEFVVSGEEFPEVIEIDLTGMNVHDSVHINAIALPEGVKPTIERNFTICTVAAPSGLKSAEAEG